MQQTTVYVVAPNNPDGIGGFEPPLYASFDKSERDTMFENDPNKARRVAYEFTIDLQATAWGAMAKLSVIDRLVLGVKGCPIPPEYILHHIECCNSQYFKGHHLPVIQVDIDHTTRVHHIKTELLSYSATEHLEHLDDESYKRAVEEGFKGIHPLKTFCPGLERREPDDDDYDVQAFFVLETYKPEAAYNESGELSLQEEENQLLNRVDKKKLQYLSKWLPVHEKTKKEQGLPDDAEFAFVLGAIGDWWDQTFPKGHYYSGAYFWSVDPGTRAALGYHRHIAFRSKTTKFED